MGQACLYKNLEVVVYVLKSVLNAVVNWFLSTFGISDFITTREYSILNIFQMYL